MTPETPKPTPDEKPKSQIAQKVVIPKRRYFSPQGVSVEAANQDEATTLVQQELAVARKEGDG